MSWGKKLAAGEALSKMGQQVSKEKKHDGKDWARNILARKEKPSPTVIRMAQTALGIEV